MHVSLATGLALFFVLLGGASTSRQAKGDTTHSNEIPPPGLLQAERPAPMRHDTTLQTNRLWRRQALRDDWGGLRPYLAGKGLRFETVYTTEVFSVVNGGLQRGTTHLGNVDLTLTVDLAEQLDWKGATLFFYILGNHGGALSEKVGELQGLTNIEAPTTLKLYEAWFEQTLFEDRLSFKAGLYDLNTEFDAIETAGLFINSSHGIGPDFSQSGVNGPSIFPTTSLGVRVKASLTKRVSIQAVVLDGVPGDPNNPRGTHIKFGKGEGALLTSELTYLANEKAGVPFRRVVLGTWYYTAASTEDASGNAISPSHNRGLYFVVEQSIYRESEDRSQGLTLFGRYGIAEGVINQLASYLGGGAVYQGLLPGRGEDQLGFAVATAYNSSPFRDAMQQAGHTFDHSEVVLELTYRTSITPWLAIQPDVQYIINPGTDPTIGNALVVGTRLEFSF